MPADTSEYGYAYWFRYTTLYPIAQTSGKNEAWYVMSRMSVNNPGDNLKTYGDRTLSIWQG